MSVYKKDDPLYLLSALKSIFNDQCLKPRDIVIVGDGPLPQSIIKIIDEFKKNVGGNVVNFVPLNSNVGLAAALNEGIIHCRYELIARMDSDDIALSERFSKQYYFMLSNHDIDVCGGHILEIDAVSEKILSERKVPLVYNNVLKYAKSRSPMNHPTVMFKKSVIIKLGGYPNFRKSQDYALWSLLLVSGYKLANCDDFFLKMRTGKELLARRGIEHFKNEIKVLGYQRKIKFLTLREYFFSIFIRAVFRLSPIFIRKLLYKMTR
ncbi:glycosyltransferase [Enterobacter hormaechei]|nr:glycosyltransferase [Enterobacter hormaechei]EKZ9487290.1 glycosyltransferase [Enterobacter hormaechei]MBF1949285.1 glycosyltransferase [Enterobacter hormaechei]HBL8869840.1 glycosyltransferase [Enterobacter hormaechei]